jgi:hypothetical protein
MSHGTLKPHRRSLDPCPLDPLSRRRRPLHPGLAAAVLPTLFLALALAAPATARAQNPDFSWRGMVPQGQAIEIKGVNGAIRAEAATGTEVEVVATRSARKSDPDEVTFDVITHQEGVTICAVYPSHGSRPNECRPGKGGRMETRNNDVNVEFTIRVPRGVHFTGRTVNGDVEAISLPGDIAAHTVNGGIRLTTAGIATATTVNGSIAVTLGRADWTGTNHFETVNGAITLDLPAALSAELEARTVNGGITTDFPIQVQGRIDRRRISGAIGDGGGRKLEVSTVNGSIRLRKIDVAT